MQPNITATKLYSSERESIRRDAERFLATLDPVERAEEGG
jgi:hypothetical protein